MSQPVLLYDGNCGLCHRVVRRLLRTDRSGRLKFATLQSAPAQTYLRTRGLPTADFDSLVFVPDWDAPESAGPLLRTEGALAAAAVVVTTGQAGSSDRVRSSLAGCDAYLNKPLMEAEFLAVLREIDPLFR